MRPHTRQILQSPSNIYIRFLWAYLQMEALSQCHSHHAIQASLDTLPDDLAKTYDRMMERIPPHHKHDAMRLLLFLVYSGRPLTLDEARDVIATQSETEPRGFDDLRMPFPGPVDILKYCPSLIALDHDELLGRILQLAHVSMGDYLTGRPGFKDPDASISITWACLTYLDAIGPETHGIDAKFPFRSLAWNFWKRHGAIAEFSGQIVEKSVSLLWERATAPVIQQVIHLASHFTLSPFSAACAGGFTETAKRLMERGALEPDLLSEALDIATEKGHEGIVRLLLDETRLDPGSLSQGLRIASGKGHEGVARLLLEQTLEPGSLEEALLIATIRGQEGIVRLLAEKELGPESVSECLNMASAEGHRGMAQLLLEKKPDTQMISEAISVASANGHQDVAMLLSEAKAQAEAEARANNVGGPSAVKSGTTPRAIPVDAATGVGHGPSLKAVLGGNSEDTPRLSTVGGSSTRSLNIPPLSPEGADGASTVSASGGVRPRAAPAFGSIEGHEKAAQTQQDPGASPGARISDSNDAAAPAGLMLHDEPCASTGDGSIPLSSFTRPQPDTRVDSGAREGIEGTAPLPPPPFLSGPSASLQRGSNKADPQDLSSLPPRADATTLGGTGGTAAMGPPLSGPCVNANTGDNSGVCALSVTTKEGHHDGATPGSPRDAGGSGGSHMETPSASQPGGGRSAGAPRECVPRPPPDVRNSGLNSSGACTPVRGPEASLQSRLGATCSDAAPGSDPCRGVALNASRLFSLPDARTSGLDAPVGNTHSTTSEGAKTKGFQKGFSTSPADSRTSDIKVSSGDQKRTATKAQLRLDPGANPGAQSGGSHDTAFSITAPVGESEGGGLSKAVDLEADLLMHRQGDHSNLPTTAAEEEPRGDGSVPRRRPVTGLWYTSQGSKGDVPRQQSNTRTGPLPAGGSGDTDVMASSVRPLASASRPPTSGADATASPTRPVETIPSRMVTPGAGALSTQTTWALHPSAPAASPCVTPPLTASRADAPSPETPSSVTWSPLTAAGSGALWSPTSSFSIASPSKAFDEDTTWTPNSPSSARSPLASVADVPRLPNCFPPASGGEGAASTALSLIPTPSSFASSVAGGPPSATVSPQSFGSRAPVRSTLAPLASGAIASTQNGGGRGAAVFSSLPSGPQATVNSRNSHNGAVSQTILSPGPIANHGGGDRIISSTIWSSKLRNEVESPNGVGDGEVSYSYSARPACDGRIYAQDPSESLDIYVTSSEPRPAYGTGIDVSDLDSGGGSAHLSAFLLAGQGKAYAGSQEKINMPLSTQKGYHVDPSPLLQSKQVSAQLPPDDVTSTGRLFSGYLVAGSDSSHRHRPARPQPVASASDTAAMFRPDSRREGARVRSNANAHDGDSAHWVESVSGVERGRPRAVFDDSGISAASTQNSRRVARSWSSTRYHGPTDSTPSSKRSQQAVWLQSGSHAQATAFLVPPSRGDHNGAGFRWKAQGCDAEISQQTKRFQSGDSLHDATFTILSPQGSLANAVARPETRAYDVSPPPPSEVPKGAGDNGSSSPSTWSGSQQDARQWRLRTSKDGDASWDPLQGNSGRAPRSQQGATADTRTGGSEHSSGYTFSFPFALNSRREAANLQPDAADGDGNSPAPWRVGHQENSQSQPDGAAGAGTLLSHSLLVDRWEAGRYRPNGDSEVSDDAASASDAWLGSRRRAAKSRPGARRGAGISHGERHDGGEVGYSASLLESHCEAGQPLRDAGWTAGACTDERGNSHRTESPTPPLERPRRVPNFDISAHRYGHGPSSQRLSSNGPLPLAGPGTESERSDRGTNSSAPSSKHPQRAAEVGVYGSSSDQVTAVPAPLGGNLEAPPGVVIDKETSDHRSSFPFRGSPGGGDGTQDGKLEQDDVPEQDRSRFTNSLFKSYHNVSSADGSKQDGEDRRHNGRSFGSLTTGIQDIGADNQAGGCDRDSTTLQGQRVGCDGDVGGDRWLVEGAQRVSMGGHDSGLSASSSRSPRGVSEEKALQATESGPDTGIGVSEDGADGDGAISSRASSESHHTKQSPGEMQTHGVCATTSVEWEEDLEHRPDQYPGFWKTLAAWLEMLHLV